MIWSEVPVYALKTANLAKPGVTELAAKELEKNIVANQNHPSVLLWSIANELSSRPGPTQASYIKNAVRQAKRARPEPPGRPRRRRLPARSAARTRPTRRST